MATRQEVIALVQQIQKATDPQAARELRKRLLEAVALTPKR